MCVLCDVMCALWCVKSHGAELATLEPNLGLTSGGEKTKCSKSAQFTQTPVLPPRVARPKLPRGPGTPRRPGAVVFLSCKDFCALRVRPHGTHKARLTSGELPRKGNMRTRFKINKHEKQREPSSRD